jgi:hypothetical protein
LPEDLPLGPPRWCLATLEGGDIALVREITPFPQKPYAHFGRCRSSAASPFAALDEFVADARAGYVIVTGGRRPAIPRLWPRLPLGTAGPIVFCLPAPSKEHVRTFLAATAARYATEALVRCRGGAARHRHPAPARSARRRAHARSSRAAPRRFGRRGGRHRRHRGASITRPPRWRLHDVVDGRR